MSVVNKSKLIKSPVTVLNTFEAEGFSGHPLFLDYPTFDSQRIELGVVSEYAGKSAYHTLLRALDLFKMKQIDGMIYAPLNKEALHLGECRFDSEIQLFKEYLNWEGPCCELNVLDQLWTSRVTSHVPLGQVASLITAPKVFAAI